MPRRCGYHKYEGGTMVYWDMDSYADAATEIRDLLGRELTERDRWERHLVCYREDQHDEDGCQWERLHTDESKYQRWLEILEESTRIVKEKFGF